MILAGDVGGTKIALGLFAGDAAPPLATLRPRQDATFASADFSGLADVVGGFLRRCGVDARQVRAACFGVAGPVIDDTTRTPNLAWAIDGREVAAATGLPAVWLINDLAATAEGIATLAAEDLATLQDGLPDAAGNCALIAAGTGLGMALMPRFGGALHPVACEGGHQDFAARAPAELALLADLARRYGGHVSLERVVSGPGLVAIYEHLLARQPGAGDPDLRDRLESTDAARAITRAARQRDDPLATLALDLFTTAYGAAAGNLALVALATAGLYVGGGIAPKILDELRGGAFLAAFHDKGRFRPLLERIPVHVILQPATALFGAARAGFRKLEETRR